MRRRRLLSLLGLVAAVGLVLLFRSHEGPEREPVGPDADGALERARAVIADAPDRETVSRLAGEGATVLPVLVEALTDGRRHVREGAAEGLGRLGAAAAPAVPALIAAYDDSDDFVRWKVIQALGRIGPAASDALPLLERSAEEKLESEIVRASAQRAIERIRGD